MSKETQITPVLLDLELLNQKAHEAAMKGAMETIENYYCKWNSPYREGIEQALKDKEIQFSFQLPDIVALINEKLTIEIDKIANRALAETFLPLVQRALVREDKEIEFSEILTEFIEAHSLDDNSEYECEVNKIDRYDWLEVMLTAGDKKYSMTFHQTYESRENKDTGRNKKYHLLSLPTESHKYDYKETMELSLEGATLKIPFRRDALENNFTAFMARLIIGDCQITMNVDDFEDDMFDDDCHC